MEWTDYNAAKQVAYSHNVVDMVNPETGEIVPTLQVQKSVFGGDLFLKTMPLFYNAMYTAFRSTCYQVIFYIFMNMRKTTNEFVGTYKTVEKQTGLSAASVIRGFKWARENDFIRMVSPGIWMVNPYMIAVGDNVAIQKLRVKYSYLKGEVK